MRREIAALRQDMNDEFKAVREDMANLSERLMRVGTLLEQGVGRSEAPESPRPE